MENPHNLELGVDKQEQTFQYAECKCDKGKCIEKDGKMVCSCPPEFGVYKWQAKVECRACECGKGANCTFIPSILYLDKECVCSYGFKESGGKCVDPCTKTPCKNGGICIADGKPFTCVCKAPYYGLFCEADPCTTNPCKNRGICNIDGDSFKCDCVSPFSGKTCDEDPCTTNPCKNRGTCKVDGKSFKCDCTAPYSGNTCERDPCTTNPCKNGGTCK
ncbi:hypothetical protein JTE90_015744, partial [Oedothorax gibbosus]